MTQCKLKASTDVARTTMPMPHAKPFRRTRYVFVILGFGLPFVPLPGMAENVPDALSVEWQGKKPCEKLYEDAQVRVARCTFPPGTVHVCHSHPSYLTYVLSGGQAQVQDEKGTRKIEIVAGTFSDVAPIPWHEFSNAGDSTLQYLVVEKKYQPVPIADKDACPRT
jgi:quercetin dioxygenase-like cupin family protein